MAGWSGPLADLQSGVIVLADLGDYVNGLVAWGVADMGRKRVDSQLLDEWVFSIRSPRPKGDD